MVRKSSIQKRIIVLVTVGMLSVLVFLGVLSSTVVDQSINRTLQERLNLAEMTALYLDYVIKQNIDTLQGVTFTEGVNILDSDLEPERRALRNAYFHTIFSDGVYIVNTLGQTIWREPSPNAPADLSNYAHIKMALRNGRPTVSNIYLIDGTGRPVVSIVIPIRDAEGEMVGLIGGDIDLTSATIQKLIRPIGLSPSGYVQVVDSNGVVVAGSRQADILTESDHSNRLAQLIYQKQPKVSTCHDCHQSAQDDGVPTARDAEVMAFVPLETAPWGLVIREAEKDALAPAYALQRQFLLLGAPMFLLSLILAWATAQSVIRPVQALTRTAEEIASGNLSAATPDLGEDEIGKLALAFNTMRLRLKESLDSFQHLTKELEDRVEQRTRELSASQQQLMQRNEELSLLYEEILHKDQLRGDLLRKVISAQEEERKRIARELHDETSQSLAALVVALEAAALAPFRNRTDVRQRIENTKQLAVRALEEIHKMIFDLRPSLLDDLGLIPAINWYAESRLNPLGTRVRIEVSGNERRLEPEVETALFRIVQEAISNTAKHADADNVTVMLDFNHSSILVEIEDDGNGFDVQRTLEAARRDDGFGLLGMRERVALLDGQLEIVSEPGSGTTIKVKVPVNQRSDNHAEDTSAARR